MMWKSSHPQKNQKSQKNQRDKGEVMMKATQEQWKYIRRIITSHYGPLSSLPDMEDYSSCEMWLDQNAPIYERGRQMDRQLHPYVYSVDVEVNAG